MTIETADSEWTVEPFNRAFFGVDDALYTVNHGYIYKRFSVTDISWASVYSPRQTFVFMRGAE